MSVPRLRLTPALGLFSGAAIAILAGASFNIQGRPGQFAIPGMIAGLLAFGAGLAFRWWRYAAPAALAALAVHLASYRFDLHNEFLRINLAGLLALGLGGVLSTVAYSGVTFDLRRRMEDMKRLNQRLDELHRVFMAATEDSALEAGNLADLPATTARHTGSAICVYYLAAEGGFLPQEPAFGLEDVRPAAVRPTPHPDPLISTIAADRVFACSEAGPLRCLFDVLPPRIDSALVVPMRVGGAVGGFVLLANRPDGYADDDRRLAVAMANRAGAHIAVLNAMSAGRREAQRFAMLSDLLKATAGLGFEEVLHAVLERSRDAVAFDGARTVLFEADAYRVAGMPGHAVPLSGSALEPVRHGRTVIRAVVTSMDGLYCGLEPPEGHAVSEALVPILGREGVPGALCLGRRAGGSFGPHDIPALEELGSVAGVALENARAQDATGDRSPRLETALRALDEVSSVLAASGDEPRMADQRVLESACRLCDVQRALVTRAAPGGGHVVAATIGVGRPGELDGARIPDGQGLLGAAFRTSEPVAVSDLAASWDMQDPVLLSRGVRSALVVPLLQGPDCLGTISVFDAQPRTWPEEAIRGLQALGSAAVLAAAVTRPRRAGQTA